MAHIVGGFIVPHNPIMFAAPDAAPEAARQRIYGAYAAAAERIGALGATTAVIIGCDHYILFGTHCLPQYIIGTGEVEGPLDQLPGLKRGPISANPALARHIAETGFAEGFDFTVGRMMTVDHSIAIPHKLLLAPHPDITTIPIMLAAGVDPYLRKRRAFDLGGLIRRAISAFPSNEKVVVIGSGGISHWVGSEQTGRVNTDFDRLVLDAVADGDVDALIALDDDYILEHGGNGAMEIRTFICAMGAMGPVRGDIIAYEPVEAWITGMGFAELRTVDP
ncbi:MULTISPECIES: protocatechuate 3,4-dioxygenase [unclassified Beijerinckia]|uniref:DODA-type extradiol aromatic ring-opening family dioxygenase n=1 Tax=unclassified Beijerinckia TaxID=2638183 RepID=UPI00089B7518|nr:MULTISPECIES: protocatechuate 3,4-dioxygenase [unclassified Beijerinckia]MDH7799043.1 protocatechuate 4,5-dioxygenase beta chain [Beijerinckia sp. GAS462]SED96902.1 protocatechuate 4,5-dioxygenase, beta chain [Beijerinckia sp. 28-YEA-48]